MKFRRDYSTHLNPTPVKRSIKWKNITTNATRGVKETSTHMPHDRKPHATKDATRANIAWTKSEGDTGQFMYSTRRNLWTHMVWFHMQPTAVIGVSESTRSFSWLGSTCVFGFVHHRYPTAHPQDVRRQYRQTADVIVDERDFPPAHDAVIEFCLLFIVGLTVEYEWFYLIDGQFRDGRAR